MFCDGAKGCGLYNRLARGRPVPKLGPVEIGYKSANLVSVFATGPRAVGFTIVLGGRVVTMQMTT